MMSGARAGRDWCERSFRKRTPFRLLWPRLMSVSFVYVCVCILVWVGLRVCGSVCVGMCVCVFWEGGGHPILPALLHTPPTRKTHRRISQCGTFFTGIDMQMNW